MPIPAVFAAAAPYVIPAVKALAAGAAYEGGRRAVNRIGNDKKNPVNKGVTAAPSGPQVFPGTANSPDVISQNLGNEGSALLFNKFNPQQVQLMQLLSQIGSEGLKNTNFSFEPIEQQARQGFAQSTLPSIAERFTGLGAQHSNAFTQALGAAGSGLETDLAAQKQLYNMNLLGAYSGLAGQSLTPQYESIFSPKGPSFGQSLATSAAGPISGAATLAFLQWLMQQQNSAPTETPKPKP